MSTYVLTPADLPMVVIRRGPLVRFRASMLRAAVRAGKWMEEHPDAFYGRACAGGMIPDANYWNPFDEQYAFLSDDPRSGEGSLRQ